MSLAASTADDSSSSKSLRRSSSSKAESNKLSNVSTSVNTKPATGPNKTKTLHEMISKKFNKTSSGRIFTKDIKDIYSTLIIGLNLIDKSSSKFKINPLSKTYPYSFSIDAALSTLQNLNVDINLSSTTTTISYNIKPELGIVLLKKFMNGKLLHTPADRTRQEPKVGVALQPTPKGLAILQNFVKRIGLGKEKIPQILSSNFNSMEIFNFDRDQLSDSVIHSDYFIHLLFIRFMSTEPNVWSPYNLPDELPSIRKQFESDDIFDFSIFSGENFPSVPQQTTTTSNSIIKLNRKTEHQSSPFHHKFFTNPESDSHIQYYVSSKGVRCYKDRFNSDHVFTGKAAVQWLSDCTDIIYQSEILEVANLFLQKKLIEAVTQQPSISNSNSFKNDRNAFYQLSALGIKVCQWNKHVIEEPLNPREVTTFIKHYKDLSNSSESLISTPDSTKKLTLKDVLRDPGMRYLFRIHLENEFCVENLNVYFQIRQFDRKLSNLGKLLILKESGKLDSGDTAKLNEKIIKLGGVCLSSAYHIYFTYLANGAPSELNIDFMLREDITRIMMHPESATSEKFFIMDLKTPIDGKSGLAILEEEKDNSSLSTISSEEIVEDPSFLETHRLNHGSVPPSPGQHIIPPSPTSKSIVSNLKVLKSVSPIFEKIRQHIYRLMEIDSLPKFILSDIYNETVTTINAVV